VISTRSSFEATLPDSAHDDLGHPSASFRTVRFSSQTPRLRGSRALYPNPPGRALQPPPCLLLRALTLTLCVPPVCAPGVCRRGPLPQLDLSALGVISSQVQDGPNKIFIGGLPYHLADEQVRELLTAFGALKAFHLVREPGSATSKGYGFCEYQEPSVTVKACAGLNGMALGDKTLTVKMATNKAQGGGPMPHAHVAQANAAAAAGLLAAPPPMMLLPGMMGGAPGAGAGGGGFSVAGALQAALAGGGPGAGGPPSAPATAAQGALAAAMPPTRVLVLLNMVSPGDLGDPSEYRDILEDVRDEAAKHGQVLRVVIPRPGDPGLRSPAAVGKAYVEFAAPHFAQAAAVALAGRQFGQRVVRIEYFDENKFAAGHLE